MPSPLALALAAILLAPAAAAADDEVCIEYMDHHLSDPKWEQACLEWLDSLAPPDGPTTGTSAASESEPAIASVGNAPPRHVGATDLALAAGDQNEIAVDPSPGGAGRAFAISKTHPFTNGVFAAHSSDPTDPATSWNPLQDRGRPKRSDPGGSRRSLGRIQ